MTGIVIELLISWLLLKYFEHQNLQALGLQPTGRHLKEFLSGFVLPLLYFSLLYLLIAVAVKNPYRLNQQYSFKNFLNSIAYVIRAVAYEDLIFRGALLYILIRRAGVKKAVWLSAVCFGIYHWFSWNAWGNPVQMVIIFLTTGMAGYIFALAFEKTRSMYLPFALHLGIDFTTMIIFSQDKQIGAQLLIKSFVKDPYAPGGFVSIAVLLFYYAGFPLLSLLYFKYIKTGTEQLLKNSPPALGIKAGA